MNKKTLIIGSGGIGSRHLQGILKSNFTQDIYVYDISKSSLENCKTRELEIKHSIMLNILIIGLTYLCFLI